MSDHPKLQQGMWCHIEIPTADLEKSKEFYGEVFGWKFTDVDMGGHTYSLYDTGGGGIGGGLWNPPEGIPRQPINYIDVEEIEPIVAAAEQRGGKVLLPMQEIPNTGWFSLLQDPAGNVLGIWKQNPQGH